MPAYNIRFSWQKKNFYDFLSFYLPRLSTLRCYYIIKTLFCNFLYSHIFYFSILSFSFNQFCFSTAAAYAKNLSSTIFNLRNFFICFYNFFLLHKILYEPSLAGVFRWHADIKKLCTIFSINSRTLLKWNASERRLWAAAVRGCKMLTIRRNFCHFFHTFATHTHTHAQNTRAR